MGANLSYPEVDLSGRTAVVTGGNTGIGYETAKALARMGCKVTIACRTKERAEGAIEKMRGELPEKSLDVAFAKLDLSSLASTQAFAQEFASQNEQLHLLILNAGLAFVPYGTTADGFETHFQVNYLSHFLLLLSLLPLVQRSPDPRVIFLSSKGHTFGSFDLRNLQGERQYKPFNFYCNSKLHMVLSPFKLSRQLPDSGIAFLSVHPGQVLTELQRDFHGFWKGYTSVMKAVGGMRNAVDGAATTIFAAVSSDLAGRQSVYLDSCKIVQASSAARNEQFQDELWNYSLALVREYLSDDAVAAAKINWQSVEAFWEAEKLERPHVQHQEGEAGGAQQVEASAQVVEDVRSATADEQGKSSEQQQSSEQKEPQEVAESEEPQELNQTLQVEEPSEPGEGVEANKPAESQEQDEPKEVVESQETVEESNDPTS